MDAEKYFEELSRMLAKAGIETVPVVQNGCLPIMLNGWSVGWVQAGGGMFRRPTDLSTHEAAERYHQAAPICAMVKEYLTAMGAALHLRTDTGNDSYLLLAEFNGVILAGKETHFGYQFATWERDASGTGFHRGDYFLDGYAAAKEDFALRAGLIAEERLFTDEQLTEIYSCIQDTLERDVPLTDKQTVILEKASDQIVSAVPDLGERIAQTRTQAPEMGM